MIETSTSQTEPSAQHWDQAQGSSSWTGTFEHIIFFSGKKNISNISYINTNIYICLPEQANINSLPLKIILN